MKRRPGRPKKVDAKVQQTWRVHPKTLKKFKAKAKKLGVPETYLIERAMMWEILKDEI